MNRDAGPVEIGSVRLANPVMTASGTAGYGTELAGYFDLSALGAVVVKSLAAYEWAGNPAPRLHPTPMGMLNSVGLQGPGVAHWLEHTVPELVGAGATVVASIWGRTVDEYRRAAELLAAAPRGGRRGRGQPVVPQPRGAQRDLRPRSGAVGGRARRHRRVRPSPLGQAQRQHRPHRRRRRRRPRGRCGGGDLHQHAARAWRTTRRRARRRSAPAGEACRGRRSTRSPCAPSTTSMPPCRGSPVIGVGGVATGWDARELLLAGAVAVQIGTATFADPRAPLRVLEELRGG